MLQNENKALKYHRLPRPGKTEVVPTKPLCTPEELALAHTPGATEASRGISLDRWNAYKYTNKGNLIAIVSNGSALPKKEALAAKPLGEGTSMLYKIFADIDAFDIEIAQSDTRELVRTIQAMSPTFGGISLEAIAPQQSLLLEEFLGRLLDIPIMSGTIQGTNVCIAAALKNAAEITGRELGSLKIVIKECDTLASTSLSLLANIGAGQSNIKTVTDADIKQWLDGADALIDLSHSHTIDAQQLQTMAPEAIIITLDASEGLYNKILRARPDAIVATAGADAPNQINSLLVAPHIFRAALDTLATSINSAMITAAVEAVATLAHRPTPTALQKMYGGRLTFGRDYILPRAGDRRLATELGVAAAEAAIRSGIARRPILDWDDYRHILLDRLESETRFCREIYSHHTSKKLRRRYTRAFPQLKM